MADIVDLATEFQDAHLAQSLRRVGAAIEAGVPGECDECGEDMPRLVAGRCGFCRDGRRPPPDFYDRSPRQRPPSKETIVMTAKATPKSRVISLPASGAVLAAIETRASDRDLPLGQAAGSLIEDAINGLVEEALDAGKPAPSEWDGTKAGAAIFFANLPDAWLIEELVRRLDSGVGTDDFDAAVARAEAAESKLATLRTAFAELG